MEGGGSFSTRSIPALKASTYSSFLTKKVWFRVREHGDEPGKQEETHVDVTRSVTLPLAETVLASSGWAEGHRRVK